MQCTCTHHVDERTEKRVRRAFTLVSDCCALLGKLLVGGDICQLILLLVFKYFHII